MILISNGCSISAGDEISGKGEIYTIENNTYNYANLLAKKINAKHINLSEGANGNSRITRITLEYLETQLEYFNDDIFVLIGWSGFTRMEFYYKHFFKKFTLGKDFRYKNHELETLYKEWQTFLIDPIQTITEKINNIILMQNYLENKKINYCFLNTVNGLNQIKTCYYDQDNLLNLRIKNIQNMKNFYKPNTSLFDLTKQLNLGFSYQHPSKKAHEYFSNELYNFIQCPEIK